MNGSLTYRRRQHRRTVTHVAVALLVGSCLAGTYTIAGQLHRWSIGSIREAHRQATDRRVPQENRVEAIVAMQRDATASMDRLDELSEDRDPVVAQHARNALEAIERRVRR